ncbi:MAG: RNA polymerase factor sigma-54 [Gammaproteobacteria bacterium]|nr:RNA polymerase factor sigma-54 [Gammaproteobacteria bacterium]
MKQSLQLRLGQHLTMTPQLQQAIRLLQLSTLELQQEIQEALESNPMLESTENSEDTSSPGEESGPESPNFENDGSSADGPTDSPDLEFRDTPDIEFKSDTLPEELPVDSAWEDVYDVTTVSSASSGSGSANGDDDAGKMLENRNAETESLRDHLMWQARLTPFTPTDMVIATAIIDSVNEDGYLGTTVEEIWNDLKTELVIDVEDVLTVLHTIQHYEPVGVAARDLRECLTIQLNQLPPETLWVNQAKALIKSYFELLANRDYAQLQRKMKINQDQLREVLKLVQALDPRPGNQVTTTGTEYVVPDVMVSKTKIGWKVELNGDATPKLRINSLYAGMVQRANKSADNTYMQGQLQEARWFIKSLQSRNETLLKVASCIVERQRAFLEHGEEAMKALVLHDIAEAVGMHESTISRITTKKYMHTPRGIFELKYFFSSHVSTDSGGECSSTAIRALIKKLVANEDARKPLSDSKIAKILSEQGINVARRTVAKYRDVLVIPPSNERKRLS